MPAAKSGIWRNPKHGTSTGYMNYHCRCDECRRWNTRKMQLLRTKQPEWFKAYYKGRYGRLTKETLRAKVLQRYGLTAAKYASLLKAQNGTCAICGRPPKEGSVLRVDHDHSCCSGQRACGKCVRGLLCGPCNTAIATLGDSVSGLTRALNYLNRHPVRD